MDWLQLPVEVVTAILQHVPLHERFNSCALVCKQWADATAAAPATSLSLVLDTTEVLQQAWETHAVCLSPQLTQLHLSATAGDWHTLDLSSTLPCTRLRSLTLSNVRVAAKGLVVLLQAATCLTQLCLQQGSVHGGPKEHHLTVLANLPNRLQHLVLDMYGRFYALPLPDGLVVQLPPHLTHLHLSAGWEGYYTRPLWSQATAQHISTLTKLKHLAVHTDSDEVLIAAPSGLLQLSWLTHLEMAGRSHVLGSSIPRLAALPALQRLVLQALRRAAHLDSEVFVGLTQLQHMQLKNVHVDEALLARVQQQQHLTALYLELPWHNPPSAAAAPKPAAFSALTSSSRLQQLCLHGAALPSAAWQHIFAAGQQLQQLTYLSIGTHNVHSLTLDGWQAMVQACPALQQLCLVMAAAGLDPADLHLPQLLPLSCLTSLRLERSNDAVLPQLLQLTRLRDLSLPGSSFNDFHVMQLTALQRLTALRWSSTKLSNRLKYRLQKVAVGLKPLIGLQAGSSPVSLSWQLEATLLCATRVGSANYLA